MCLCPVAVSEDTGGSTRVPALYNGVFGFDPCRNHYPNEGNPGLTYTRDQIGVHARSIGDVLLYDRAIADDADGVHAEAAAAAAARSAATPIRIGAPERPFVVGPDFRADAHMRAKYEQALAALRHSGSACDVVAAEWPSEGDAAFAEIAGRRTPLRSAGGQASTWVHEYLGAKVALADIVEDIAPAGASHHPAGIFRSEALGDETSFRAALGPKVARAVAGYNRLFDEHGLDLIVLPAAYARTPTLAQTAAGAVPLESAADGSTVHTNAWPAVYPHNEAFKDLHIPKLAVPTGLCPDGRPTGVQLWGPAVPYAEMFDDRRSTEHSVAFLHLAARAVEAIHSDAGLRPVAPKILASS